VCHGVAESGGGGEVTPEEIQAIRAKFPRAVDLTHCQNCEALVDLTRALTALEETQQRLSRETIDTAALVEIDRVLAEHEKTLGGWYHHDKSRQTRLHYMLAHHRDLAEKAVTKGRQLREKVAAEIRAIALVAEAVGDAGTHREKEARARVLTCICNTALDRLDGFDFEERWETSYWPELNRSEYPYRRYLDKIRELESQVEQLKAERGQGSSPSADPVPF
jgi:hypothetical protein